MRKIMWFIQSSASAGLITAEFDHQLNVKLRAEAQRQKKIVSPSTPCGEARSKCGVHYVIFFPNHPQMLYDMRMYVYICLYIELHTQRRACVADMSVMHIYRYIMKEENTFNDHI